ncbi:uncharacterized protein LOC129576714 [Sitodiplosis mosellana]|uniref:uncharacterized protein LOC129576714 n=1 Tax=Sitodiplosis mosellana TaxID=263140 RepID=UPI002443FC62|nr:uncharacterized protein LOC129576714 [Sitodiplosis mosellana]
MKLDHFVCCIFASILVIFSCAQQYNCLSHDSTIGLCSNVSRNNSVPILSKVIHKPNNKFMKYFRKTDVTIRFPEVGELAYPITCILIKDIAANGTGGFAMIQEGGINFRHVKIYFKSQTGCDIRFNVDIFAQTPYGIPPTSYGTQVYPNVGAPYPNNAAQGYPAQPAGWIYPSNNYQQQQPYVFNRN